MQKKYKLSIFSEFYDYDKHLVVWNKMLGGLYNISDKKATCLKMNKIVFPYFTVDEIFALLKNNIIVPIDLDEQKELQSLRTQSIQDAVSGENLRCLELSISEDCNYRCVYCTFWRTKNISSRKLISKKNAERAVKDFLNITGRQKNTVIYFGTAEPFLNWEVLSYLAPIVHALRQDVSLNAITNGSMVSLDQLRFCKDNKINLGISLDGLPERQKLQRVPKTSSIDSSAVVLQLLETGKEIGYKFNCLSATYRQTGFKKDVDYLIDLCKKYDIPEFDLDFDAHCLGSVDADILANELLYSYKLAREYNINTFGYWLIPYLNITDGRRGIKSFCGNVAGESVCISSRGEFKLCGYERVGLQTYSMLQTHLASMEFQAILKARLLGNNPRCNTCCIKGVCNGQCMLTDIGSKEYDNTCSFYQKITKKLLANHY